MAVQAFGEMSLQVRAADALLAGGARAVERPRADLTAATAGEGTRSALDSLDLHRRWRNARTHTLHDPATWKVQHLGRHAVDGTLPPDHGQI